MTWLVVLRLRNARLPHAWIKGEFILLLQFVTSCKDIGSKFITNFFGPYIISKYLGVITVMLHLLGTLRNSE
ncbi:hypothetical protein PR048_018486 [Dryococelus australis]|uniref:Uncharacterized protein n=1 Tax=Dryococelus australis TaxID=614101 RepID=A0ABQ9HCF8_9NEOP|nr:hypothetical protein PR048_018486 [Dryococelus australis]